MTISARDKIFQHIRQSLNRKALSGTDKNLLEKRMSQHPRGVLPEYANCSQDDLLELFIEKALASQAIVNVVNSVNEIDSKIFLTKGFCGVAETGTVVMLSSPETPTSQNFLPEKHFVLLNKSSIVRYYEDAWDLIRAQEKLPRCVNFITGPSRTGDIEQKVEIGIHGPKEFYIFIQNGID